MDTLKTFVDIAQTAPLALVFYLLWNNGLISLKPKNGNGNGYQKQIDDLGAHVDRLEGDVSSINTKLGKVAEDVSYIRGKLDK